MKNKLYCYFSWALALGLLACSGGVGGPPAGGVPASNYAAPIQESGTPGTRFDPDGKAKYRLSVQGDFQKTDDGTILLRGEVTKIGDKAPDFASHVLRAVDFRNQKYVDIPLQTKDDPQDIWIAQGFEVPFISAKDVIDTPAYTLVFYVSREAATNPSDQWRQTLACTDPKCDTSDWYLTILEVKPMDLLIHSNFVDDSEDGDKPMPKSGLTLIPEPAPPAP